MKMSPTISLVASCRKISYCFVLLIGASGLFQPIESSAKSKCVGCVTRLDEHCCIKQDGGRCCDFAYSPKMDSGAEECAREKGLPDVCIQAFKNPQPESFPNACQKWIKEEQATLKKIEKLCVHGFSYGCEPLCHLCNLCWILGGLICNAICYGTCCHT